MRLYLVKRKEEKIVGEGYDENHGFVVCAKSPASARCFANRWSSDEGKIWNDVDLVDCKLLGEAASNLDEGVVLCDFHAA